MIGVGAGRMGTNLPHGKTRVAKRSAGKKAEGDNPLNSDPVRPIPLAALCIAGFVGCFLNGILVISPPAQKISSWYPTYLSLSTLYVIFCLSGLWMMRRWAVMSYSFYMVVNQGVYLILGHWNWFALVLSGATTIVSWCYFRKMKGFHLSKKNNLPFTGGHP